MRAHCLLGLRNRAVDHADVRQQLPPRRRRPGAPTHALDQLQAKAPLQLPDLQADCRLRHAPALGGGGKTAQFDDLRKRAQVVQIQAAHGSHQSFVYENHNRPKLY